MRHDDARRDGRRVGARQGPGAARQAARVEKSDHVRALLSPRSGRALFEVQPGALARRASPRLHHTTHPHPQHLYRRASCRRPRYARCRRRNAAHAHSAPGSRRPRPSRSHQARRSFHVRRRAASASSAPVSICADPGPIFGRANTLGGHSRPARVRSREEEARGRCRSRRREVAVTQRSQPDRAHRRNAHTVQDCRNQTPSPWRTSTLRRPARR